MQLPMRIHIMVKDIEMWLKKNVVGREVQATSHIAGEVNLGEVFFDP